MNPICPYCLKESKKVLGDEIYPGRASTLKAVFYECLPCGAYVGCHKYTDTPLGVPADYSLRQLRTEAHLAFDWIWKNPKKTKMFRMDAYPWLARQLGILPKHCHIALFNRNQCTSAIAIVKGYKLHYNFN